MSRRLMEWGQGVRWATTVDPASHSPKLAAPWKIRSPLSWRVVLMLCHRLRRWHSIRTTRFSVVNWKIHLCRKRERDCCRPATDDQCRMPRHVDRFRGAPLSSRHPSPAPQFLGRWDERAFPQDELGFIRRKFKLLFLSGSKQRSIPAHWAHDVVATLNQLQGRWLNVAKTSDSLFAPKRRAAGRIFLTVNSMLG